MTSPEGPIEAKTSSPKPHYAGHRDRLRKRFARSGDIALEDYELLELVLFRSIPRQDTKPLAKALLERFGSLAATLGAPPELLCEVNGIGLPTAQDLKIVAAVGQRSLKSQVMDQEILNSWNSVVKYCEARMAFETREQFRILFLDRKNALIADEVQQVGTVDHTPAYPREIVSRALALSATAIILVHNHPSGDPAPSDADIAMTRTIIEAGEKLGIRVHDHLIIGKGRHASMKGLALI